MGHYDPLITVCAQQESITQMYDAVRSYIQRVFETIALDPATLETPTFPLILCSDGHTYAASTLRETICACKELRGPYSGEILRRVGIHNIRVESLLSRLGADARYDDMFTHLRTSQRVPRSIDLIRDIWGEAEASRSVGVGEVFEFSLPLVHLTSERGVAFCVISQLETEEKVVLRARVVHGENQKLDIRTPRPCGELVDGFLHIAQEFGIARSLERPEKIGTMEVVGPAECDTSRKDDIPHSLEDRIVNTLNTVPPEQRHSVSDAWRTFLGNSGSVAH